MREKEHEPVWDVRALDDPHGKRDKARRVRTMFDRIAPTYELVNSISSAGRDAVWRRKTVEAARVSAGDVVLDVACGTGDLARAFAKADPPPTTVVGVDFSPRMLALAKPRSNGAIRWCTGDALKLPFANGRFNVCSCAFGVRNFQDLDRGLREMHRVLRPGGRCVILEFGMPRRRLARVAYGFYFKHVMPVIAALISRDRSGAYRYLPRSVVSFFDSGQLAERLEVAGFDRVEVRPLTLGVVSIFVASKD